MTEETVLAKTLFNGTFVGSSPNKNHYVEIEADNYLAAREKMFKSYKKDWAFVYSSESFKSQIEEFNLKLLTRI